MDTQINHVFRAAVIGCGCISGNHINAIRKAGQEICAFCDIDRKKAEAAAARVGGGVPVFTDYIEMMDTVKPDVVHICTPHYLHAPMTVAALKRGINVLSEKPLCINLEQLEEIRRAAADSTAMLGVCHQNRYEPNMLKLKELASAGVAGGFGSVLWKRDGDYYASGAWRGKWDTEGGGVLINQALHTLDLLQWICGMPETVVGHIANDHLTDVIEVEDTASAMFTKADGTRLHFWAATSASVDFPVQLRLVQKDGTVINAENDMMTVNGKLLPPVSHGEAVGKLVWGDGHNRLIADFYRSLADGTHFPIDVEEASKVVRLILGIYASEGAAYRIHE